MSRIEQALEKAAKMREERREQSYKPENAGNGESRSLVHVSITSLFSGFSLIIFMAAFIGTFFYFTRIEGNKIKGPDKTAELRSSMKDDKPLDKIMPLLGTNCKVAVTRLTEDLLKNFPGSAEITPKELSENEFYSIQLMAMNNCLPEESIKSLDDYVYFIEQSKHIKPRELHALHDMKKVIYRQKACGGKPGIIFFRFFIACPKEMDPEGLLIGGKELLF
ncbi:MAG: hypothetical protein ABR903_07355 [Thermodesulfovibrionales bacterium]|jgi:hypothetical protein